MSACISNINFSSCSLNNLLPFLQKLTSSHPSTSFPKAVPNYSLFSTQWISLSMVSTVSFVVCIFLIVWSVNLFVYFLNCRVNASWSGTSSSRSLH